MSPHERHPGINPPHSVLVGVQDANTTSPGFYPTDGFLGRENGAHRFTDAELAAEWWKLISGLYDGHGKQARMRCDTLWRFATLPHFDEAPGWDAGTGFDPLRGKHSTHCPACGRFARLTVDGLPLCVRHGVQEVAFA